MFACVTFLATALLLGCTSASPTSLSGAATADLLTHAVYGTYQFGDDSVIDIGIQPWFLMPGIITETMKRDAILRQSLDDLGLEVRFHSFTKGADINFFLERGDIDVAIGGDMPMLVAATTTDIVVTSLVQKGDAAIVARKLMPISELRGKTIAYSPGSNAHFALLHSLSAVGLAETDVTLVAMEVTDMPEALHQGTVDAFSAWEPTPTVALLITPNAVIIQRNLTRGYLYFTTVLAERYPEAVEEIVAAEIRAIDWLRDDEDNLLQASRWTITAGGALSGESIPLTPGHYATIALQDLLNVFSAPQISSSSLDEGSRLRLEFDFLQSTGSIPPEVTWETVRSSFNLDIVKHVLSEVDSHSLAVYDYTAATSPD